MYHFPETLYKIVLYSVVIVVDLLYANSNFNLNAKILEYNTIKIKNLDKILFYIIAKYNVTSHHQHQQSNNV